jgi:UDPglucose 6-dehydrogenase
MKLGIVGHGFVGSAINQGFTNNCDKFIVDPKYFQENRIEDLTAFRPDATFVSVPTPGSESGEANTDTLFDVCRNLNSYKGHLVIVKSTVPSYKLEQLVEECVDLRIVYNPEFLTEKNYINDFRNPAMHVFGGQLKDTEKVEEIYKKHSTCRPCPVFHTDIKTASLVKYTINSFLATKVIFFNELYDVFKASGGTEFKQLTDIISNDPRIGQTHMKVPGNDGQRGYAGSCFPKDTNALAYFAREILNKPLTQLEASIKINEHLRKLRNQ